MQQQQQGGAVRRNATYILSQLGALIGNTSTGVKVICGGVCVGYCVSWSDEAVRVLAVSPGLIMPPSFWVWSAFSSCFLELYWWEVVIDIVTVGLCGKLIEPLWGAVEMMHFFGIVNVLVAVVSSCFYFILYACNGNAELLFGVHIHGLAGYIAGVSVAVKQIMPDLVLIKTPLGKLSNRNIPLSVWLVSLVLYLVGLLDGTYPTMFLCGLLISWTYLRFYQKHTNGTRGDPADYFTFASFFPNVIQPIVGMLSNSVFSVCVRVGLCKRMVRKLDLANPTGITIAPTHHDHHDMERRRQLALKALSERLSKSSNAPDKHSLLLQAPHKSNNPLLQSAAITTVLMPSTSTSNPTNAKVLRESFKPS